MWMNKKFVYQVGNNKKVLFEAFFNVVKVKAKVKQSHYRPGQALTVPAG